MSAELLEVGIVAVDGCLNNATNTADSAPAMIRSDLALSGKTVTDLSDVARAGDGDGDSNGDGCGGGGGGGGGDGVVVVCADVSAFPPVCFDDDVRCEVISPAGACSASSAASRPPRASKLGREVWQLSDSYT